MLGAVGMLMKADLVLRATKRVKSVSVPEPTERKVVWVSSTWVKIFVM